jgi:cytochrome P450
VAPDRAVPQTDLDVFSPELLDNPYPVYKQIRDLSGAVHVSSHDYWLLTRYDDVRGAAGDWETWTSSKGVALLPQFNAMQEGTVLAADPPTHTQLRSVLSEQLAPRALAKLRDDIRRQAGEIVDRVLALGEFDIIPELTQKLPVTVVADLIGLPDTEGRDTLLPGADAMFTTFGPPSEYLEARLPDIMAYNDWIASVSERSYFKPGSWGAAIFDAVDDGRIAAESAVPLMHAFLVAGMDTTANGIAAMVRFLAEKPGAWEALQADQSLAGSAFEESLRLESPVVGFFRVCTRDVEIDGVTLPEGSRALLAFGAANRDERHYPDPDTFDIRRNPLDHMAFGYGVHGCAGQGLARIEATALVQVLVERVERIELTDTPKYHFNPAVRGLEAMPARFIPKKG